MLTDPFNRVHNYLRISLTERCNLRCTYCMPEEGIVLRDRSEFMTQEETISLAKTFVDLGVTKIRLTGGEPLIKKNFKEILANLALLPVELSMTTNGILLDHYFDDLKNAGLQNLNISLDSLQKERNTAISRRDYFDRVFKNILESVELGFRVKINCVLMKNKNDDEIIDFTELTRDMPLDIRFIEFMPFDGNHWDWSKTVSFATIIEKIESYYGKQNVTGIESGANSTSRNFRINDFTGSFGIISTLTNPFCDSCNRIRLTADGKIKNCLFSSSETDLLTALRSGKDVKPLILGAIKHKHAERGGLPPFESPDFLSANRSMIRIGG